MLTKTDLSAIQKMLNSSTKEIKTDIAVLKKGVNNLEVGQKKHSEEIKDLSNEFVKTNELIKRGFAEVVGLVSPGFTVYEEKISNHEFRITHLEKITFKSN